MNMPRIYATESERLEAKRESAREWKSRNKKRRTKDGYKGTTEPSPKRYNSYKREQMQADAWWEALRKKHAKWKGKRLKRSLKPPIILELDNGYGK